MEQWHAVWVVQLDVASFFATISRPVLADLVLPEIRDPNLAAVTRQLSQHDPRTNPIQVSAPQLYQTLPQHKRWCNQPTTSGLPIGNLTILAKTPNELEGLVEPISNWLRSHRHQSINPEKTIITNLRYGINYLDYRMRQENAPKNPAQIFLPPAKKFKIVQAAQFLRTQRVKLRSPLVCPSVFCASEHGAK